MSNDDPIKWNKKRHEEHLQNQAKNKFSKELGRVFETWKKVLASQKRTVTDVQDQLELLLTKTKELAAKFPEVDEVFISYTQDLIQTHVNNISSDLIVQRNSIIEYRSSIIDERERQKPEDESIIFIADMKKAAQARRFSFKTPTEFYHIPFIRTIAGKPDFLCFVRRNEWVIGVFKDGEMVPAGKIANTIGLESMPTIEQFQEMQAKLTTEAGAAEPSADGGSAQPGGPPTPGHDGPSGDHFPA